ncbi:LysR family transcriptional regulator [Paenibacillus radicis (ex Xue et al. 2023)]|uniref:LysR family transcriptional regulator n=1 Tax=Paenibacillus radicis (ex Xue et al. 2023) TaxID=2972489 RepID=A0ABT1YCY7_9BACL|nr:LysR family transcriptional regulator [Paenibacillus radicis (ex Xue et al. 2023)]MCR8631057.1 LysR family transcriptional regulator [Paenibacillus radicis (ex Xue et al. 2023)]
MNLHALKLFYETATRGGVTKAAEALHISQPAVTAQIRNLEQELGLVLLLPQGRSSRLSEAGQVLYKYAARLFALEQEISRQMTDYREGRSGMLRISATYLPANHLLPGWMAAFKQANKGIDMMLTTANSRTAYDKLLHYEADIAVIGGSRAAPAGLVQEKLMEDELWFIASTVHPLAGQSISLSDIMKEPFILREEGSSTREKLFALCKLHNVNQPVVGLQFNGLNETIRAVMAGYGVNFLSALEVKDYIQQGVVARIHVEGVHLTNPLSVCRRTDDDLTPAAAQFLNFIREQMHISQRPASS